MAVSFPWTARGFHRLCNYSKNPHKRRHVLGFQADFVWCFLQNQPENVLKVFLKLFLKIKYSIDYQQMKSMRKHNILIN